MNCIKKTAKANKGFFCDLYINIYIQNFYYLRIEKDNQKRQPEI